ncbi:MAG: 16S rRNA (guanine(966)-N(2))-methyltransferase RsmD [Spongiibacteraceae bacterium]
MTTTRTSSGKNRKPIEPDGELRIIGGQWRGRKLRFPSLPGLRPSPDRVRETLFNWLAPEITGARCLDLFAGSGALGLEALSRGASFCQFIDAARAAAMRIESHLTLLSCGDAQTYCGDALQWLRQSSPTPFNMVFLDPPFRQDLLNECCALLDTHGWLSDRAWIYIESATDEPEPIVPPSWQLHRDKQAGQVAYRLYLRESR